jgi:mannan endo-1,4-beta-mannosidase
MRINTIRAHTLGVSVGTPMSVETALDVFNQDAYEAIDFAILAARIYGLKVRQPWLHCFLNRRPTYATNS